MKIKQPTGLEYSSGKEEYDRFQFDRISPLVEVYHIFPNGSHALNLVPKAKLSVLFKNLHRIEKMKPKDRPLTNINSKAYRVNWFTGLGTNIANDNDYITIYLEDLEGKAYEFLWFPEMVSNS